MVTGVNRTRVRHEWNLVHRQMKSQIMAEITVFLRNLKHFSVYYHPRVIIALKSQLKSSEITKSRIQNHPSAALPLAIEDINSLAENSSSDSFFIDFQIQEKYVTAATSSLYSSLRLQAEWSHASTQQVLVHDLPPVLVEVSLLWTSITSDEVLLSLTPSLSSAPTEKRTRFFPRWRRFGLL